MRSGAEVVLFLVDVHVNIVQEDVGSLAGLGSGLVFPCLHFADSDLPLPMVAVKLWVKRHGSSPQLHKNIAACYLLTLSLA
jgi:hypothetical protein